MSRFLLSNLATKGERAKGLCQGPVHVSNKYAKSLSSFEAHFLSPEKHLCERIVVFCPIAQERGVHDEDLVVEAQTLDVHLQVEAPFIFHSHDWGWFAVV